MATEEQEENERLYKTKMIEFLGRSTPIILQNDNGPCPLLAICNVLLLRNDFKLDTSEVSTKTLFSLVANRIVETNSSLEDKDATDIENPRKKIEEKIEEAINVIPRLATGIDVNILFRRIDDFEATPDRAIFGLLDIPLYHGWLVDPQDHDTANAISSKSYNTLMEKLVALESRHMEGEHSSSPEEDSVDFVAATTATLGVPSPCLSRARSFDDSPGSVSDHQKRKGDLEEEAELLRALELSSVKLPTSLDEDMLAETNRNDASVLSHEFAHVKSSESGVLADAMKEHLGDGHQFHQPELSLAQASSASNSCNNDRLFRGNSSAEMNLSFFNTAAEHHVDLLGLKESTNSLISNDLMENMPNNAVFQQGDPSSANKDEMHGAGGEQRAQQSLKDTSTPSVNVGRADHQSVCDIAVYPGSSEGVSSSIDGSEPIYEGEDCILDSGPKPYENREPMYEGEVVLAEQAERGIGDACVPMDEITEQQGVLIRSFLKSSASQLTIFGLFCLQEGLKEHELCVFFRNNHFNTMFKCNGELFLLATDQGYISQPDLVWEKLNEVNGDTVFMTSDFKEFKVEDHSSDTWDEQKAMSNTTDYLASIENSEPAGSTLNSDLQLAIALQQKEFDNQPQRQHASQQASASGNSRLVTGPQVPRSIASHSSSKQDAKSKDKCVVM